MSMDLQVLHSVQQVPRIKVLQNAALLRSEGALLVWGHTFDQVREQLTELEAQIACAVSDAKAYGSDAGMAITAAPARRINTSTPVATYLAFVGCLVIVTMEVRLLQAVIEQG